MSQVIERVLVSFEKVDSHFVHVPGCWNQSTALRAHRRFLEQTGDVVWNRRINDVIFRETVRFEPWDQIVIDLYQINNRMLVTLEQIHQFLLDNSAILGGPQLLTLIHRSPEWSHIEVGTSVLAPCSKALRRAGDEVSRLPALCKAKNGHGRFEIICPMTTTNDPVLVPVARRVT